MIHSYKDLIVWQKAKSLAVKIYHLTSKYPSSEIYGITSQMRRAAISIPSNIAEGRGRKGRKEYLNFLNIAYGSATELEAQIDIAKELRFGDFQAYQEIEALLLEVMKMLGTIRSKIAS